MQRKLGFETKVTFDFSSVVCQQYPNQDSTTVRFEESIDHVFVFSSSAAHHIQRDVCRYGIHRWRY